MTGITLSREQRDHAVRRAAELGLGERLDYQRADYRQVQGRFDRIVSVGMFEHVGRAHYDGFFARLRELLAGDGVALLHSIGRAHGPYATQPFIKKHIFPGCYIPALSEVLPAIERAGLWVTDIEILRLHYAKTLRCWQKRLAAHRREVEALYDARFYQMWEFYLVAAEQFFAREDGMNFQIQLSPDREAVPLTRDYLFPPAAAANRNILEPPAGQLDRASRPGRRPGRPAGTGSARSTSPAGALERRPRPGRAVAQRPRTFPVRRRRPAGLALGGCSSSP